VIGRAPRPVPGLPQDGQPLDDYELCKLGDVETDSLIAVPEPAYSKGES